MWASGAADVGVQTSAVLRSGLPWSEAAADHFRRNPTRGAGNGSLMRATPTAVHFANGDTDETIAAAHACSAITHGDPAAAVGTALFHVMVRAALRDDDPFAAVADQLSVLSDEHDRYRRMLAADWTPDDMEVPNGSVWGCLAQAVWAVRTTNSFADAVVAAIGLGGDTVAAVAGGLAGAGYGVQAIPSRWTTYVHGQVTTPEGVRTYDADDLQELALRLIGKTPSPMAPLGDGVGPTEIAPGLHAADLRAATDTPDDHAIISLSRTDCLPRGQPQRSPQLGGRACRRCPPAGCPARGRPPRARCS